MGTSRARRRSIGFVLSLLLLQSCMTMGLWGYEWRARIDPATGDDVGSYERMRGTRWEWWRVLLRIVATPVTVAGDASFGLAYGAMFGDEDSAPVWAQMLGDRDDEPRGPSTSATGVGPSPPPSTPVRRRSIGRPLVEGVRR